MTRLQLGQLIDPHHAEKFVDQRVVPAQRDGLAAAQQLHQLAEEAADRLRELTAEDIDNALAEQQGQGPSSDDHAPPFYEVCDAAGTKPFATCSDFMEATDVAFDALDSRDPDELVIFKVDGDSREPVWTYSRAASQNVA